MPIGRARNDQAGGSTGAIPGAQRVQGVPASMYARATATSHGPVDRPLCRGTLDRRVAPEGAAAWCRHIPRRLFQVLQLRPCVPPELAQGAVVVENSARIDWRPNELMSSAQRSTTGLELDLPTRLPTFHVL
ncbi:hypothetical protein RhiJN_24103 [Ceratobasidium sp. AG-Ba]|nr:hypothetical protein RhiJN_24103 [Ceratobasidium sp. AG-Ba]